MCERHPTVLEVTHVGPLACVDALVLIQMATLGEALVTPRVVADMSFLLLDGSLHWVRCRWGWYLRHDARVAERW